MRRKGFTLIELLVVIAIIAILAAILFPVFAKARDKARQSVCQSNLKQLGLAFQQYTQDYDGNYPYGIATWNNYNYTTSSYTVLLTPYVKNTKMFQCPNWTSSVPIVYGYPMGPDYVYNLGYGMYCDNVQKTRNESEIKTPSAMLVLADCWYEHIYQTDNPPRLANILFSHASSTVCSVMFADGHVSSMHYPLPISLMYVGQ